ncbi:MAG TPA: GNAT family N-acetyltransferase [Anaerolineales bacterium]|nr:GNAT family N-acetyltransferase [Anaerolineales bacterium]
MAEKMNEAKLVIREFNFTEDYQAVIELWSQAGSGIHLRRSDEPEEVLKKLKRDPDLFILGDYGGELVAAVLGGYDGRRGMMYHLAVAKAYRRYGIAKQLVAELESRLRLKGCIKYYLLVTKDNDEGMRFYESNGWERMDLYVYGKDL